jgi:hypothetical protein
LEKSAAALYTRYAHVLVGVRVFALLLLVKALAEDDATALAEIDANGELVAATVAAAAQQS